MGIVLFSSFGLSLDVNVRDKGLDVVTIDRMRIGLKLLLLARFQFKIIHVELVKPGFSTVWSKNRMFNFEKPGTTS